MFEIPNKKVEFVQMPVALKKAEEVLGKYATQMDDFSDLYGAEVIARDKATVASLEKRFSDGRVLPIHEIVNKQLATIFEAIIFDQGESSNWFGENAFLIKTTNFDDYVNGIDMVVEYDEEGGVTRMAAGIDVTFHHNVQKKIAKIKDSILNGELGIIKYFQSEVSDIRGEISKIPRIIIGADVDTVRELTNEWAAGNIKRLANHPVQFQFFDEAISQCKYFIKFAEENKKPEVVRAYTLLLRILEKQQQLKREAIGEDKGTRDMFMKDMEAFLSA